MTLPDTVRVTLDGILCISKNIGLLIAKFMTGLQKILHILRSLVAKRLFWHILDLEISKGSAYQ